MIHEKQNQINTYIFKDLCAKDKDAVFDAVMFHLSQSDITVQLMRIPEKNAMRVVVVGNACTSDIQLGE